MCSVALSSSAPFSLIVTADDFGFGRRVSEGIVHAHLHGPVTATSVMVVCPHALEASLPLLSDAPRLELGLHWVLSGGLAPLTNLRGSGLTDAEGRFLSNGKLWGRAWSGRVHVEAAYDELCAQAQAFKKHLGRSPAYVDAHHHAHQLPGIREALVRAMDEGIVPKITRRSVEAPGLCRVGGSRARRLATNLLGRRARRVFAAHGIHSNDSFFGMLSRRELAQPFPWKAQLGALDHVGVIEWVVHPGYIDPSLEGRDEYIRERQAELQALTDPSLALEWETLRPSLTTKSVLWGTS